MNSLRTNDGSQLDENPVAVCLARIKFKVPSDNVGDAGYGETILAGRSLSAGELSGLLETCAPKSGRLWQSGSDLNYCIELSWTS